MDDNEQERTRSVIVVLGVLIASIAAVLWFLVFRTSDRNPAHVRGEVTLDGTPVSGATVVFLPEDAKGGPITAFTGEQGDYRLVGNLGGGIPAGKYKVAVSKQALADGTVPTGEQLLQARSAGLLRNTLPAIYEDQSTTPLVFDVPAGNNVVNVQLKKNP